MEITGKYTKAKIFTENIEDNAIKQIQMLCDHPLFKDKKIRIMSDVHVSKATVVGLTCEINTEYIIPQLLGTDLCCSISAWEIKGKQNDWAKLDRVIKSMNLICPKEVKELIEYVCSHTGLNPHNYLSTFATVGKGNHFVSIEQGIDRYLLIHTGSRNLGKDVAILYSDIAQTHTNFVGEKKQLSWLFPEESQSYLMCLNAIKHIVYYSHQYIAWHICKEMKWKYKEVCFCPHNYIDGNILHKGSIHLGYNGNGIIPLNMADGSLIVRGYDAAPQFDWLYSAPHGAGRLYKRETCREQLSMQEYKKRMKDIYCSNVSVQTIDESPMAYKPAEQIIEEIDTICEIVDRTKPLYVYKEV